MPARLHLIHADADPEQHRVAALAAGAGLPHVSRTALDSIRTAWPVRREAVVHAHGGGPAVWGGAAARRLVYWPPFDAAADGLLMRRAGAVVVPAMPPLRGPGESRTRSAILAASSVEGGARVFRVATPVESPGVPISRADLGVGEDEWLVLAVGDATTHARHDIAVWVVALLHELDPRHRLLHTGRGADFSRVRRFAESLYRPRVPVSASGVLGRSCSMSDLIPLADALLLTAQGPVPPGPVAAAVASGLPMVVRGPMSRLIPESPGVFRPQGLSVGECVTCLQRVLAEHRARRFDRLAPDAPSAAEFCEAVAEIEAAVT